MKHIKNNLTNMADFFLLPWQRRVCIYATVTMRLNSPKVTTLTCVQIEKGQKVLEEEGVDSVNREAKTSIFRIDIGYSQADTHHRHLVTSTRCYCVLVYEMAF